jgi:hypothetical protein
MRLTTHAAMIAAFLLLPSPAHAQELEDQGPGDQIVVTGERAADARAREEQARDFVGALMPTQGRSMARQFDDVCPFVTGLNPAQNQAVTERLRRVAAAAGVNVGGAGCAPNTFLIVTRDKRAFINALAQRRPESFVESGESMGGIRVRRLANTPGPAAAWQLTGSRSINPSRIRPNGELGFDASALVVESRVLPGLTTTQLADYAAMRLLAKLDPARLPATSPPTILKILEAPMDSEVPITLTQWDLGLLRGLYAGSPGLSGSGQRSEIAREVAQEAGSSRR